MHVGSPRTLRLSVHFDRDRGLFVVRDDNTPAKDAEKAIVDSDTSCGTLNTDDVPGAVVNRSDEKNPGQYHLHERETVHTERLRCTVLLTAMDYRSRPKTVT